MWINSLICKTMRRMTNDDERSRAMGMLTGGELTDIVGTLLFEQIRIGNL